MAEVGYVTVSREHRGRHLSSGIVATLLARTSGPLFATTDKEEMKAVLAKNGSSDADASGMAKPAVCRCGYAGRNRLARLLSTSDLTMLPVIALKLSVCFREIVWDFTYEPVHDFGKYVVVERRSSFVVACE